MNADSPLLASRRFLPLFVTQFLGALNDNLFKSAMVILIVYRLAEAAGLDPGVLATLANGVFILPFFLFSALAGRLADRHDKTRVIAIVKACEIGFMALGAAGLFLGDMTVLFAVLFLMGAHSAFFGPIKYAILPVHLARRELLAGNALVEAGTFLAILLGTIVGGVLVLAPQGVPLVSAGLLAVALAGYAVCRFIPPAPPPVPDLALDLNLVRDSWRMLRRLGTRRDLLVPALGISWFWLVGATFQAQLPALTKSVIGGDERVVTLCFTAFSIGIALGSLLCSRLLRGEINLRIVPWGSLGIALFTFDLFFACRALDPPGATLIGLSEFLSTARGWRVFGDLLLIAIAAGIYIVPLYAALQARSPEAERSRVIATTNILNALFMVVGALAAVALLTGGLDVPTLLFVVAGGGNLAVAIGSLARRMPQK
jgi:acyl-[acyl-carrier-protein]-phospholipid O-acyltransferase/long-chain-fatty-acid--[acyl-carrier-protein] ligase